MAVASGHNGHVMLTLRSAETTLDRCEKEAAKSGSDISSFSLPMSYQSSEHISRWAEVVSAGEPLSPTSHTSSPRSPQPNYRRKKRPGRITFKKDPWTMPPPKPVQTRYTGLAERRK